jgi:hypothetical protein
VPTRKVSEEEDKTKKIDIPAKEYNELVSYVGGVMRKELMRLVDTTRYKNSDDEKKKLLLEDTIKRVKKLVKPYIEDFKKKIRKEG